MTDDRADSPRDQGLTAYAVGHSWLDAPFSGERRRGAVVRPTDERAEAAERRHHDSPLRVPAVNAPSRAEPVVIGCPGAASSRPGTAVGTYERIASFCHSMAYRSQELPPYADLVARSRPGARLAGSARDTSTVLGAAVRVSAVRTPPFSRHVALRCEAHEGVETEPDVRDEPDRTARRRARPMWSELEASSPRSPMTSRPRPPPTVVTAFASALIGPCCFESKVPRR